MTLRLAIVGCGDIAGYTAWFARLNRGIRLVAACDLSPDRLAVFSRRHRIARTTTDYAELVLDDPPDAVYLAVPHHLHHIMLDLAIQVGIPALVEKPLTRTAAGGEAIVRLAAARGVRVGVNYQYRYDAGCHALARAVQSGALGRIHFARCNIPWHRTAAYFQRSGWHRTWAQAGGGTLITQGSHFLDVILWALGEDRPESAVGYIANRRFPEVEVEDTAQGIVRMQSGALVQISSSMAAASEQAVSIEIYGERGTAIYKNLPLPHVRFRGVRVKKAKPPHRGVHALQRSLEGFRAWVMDDRPYLTPAASALPVLHTVEAVYRSARSGRRESVLLQDI